MEIIYSVKVFNEDKLINRTIDKPYDKLKLLSDFMLEKRLIERISNQLDEGIFNITDIYLDEKKICEVLKISRQTLKNWQKTYKDWFKPLDTDPIRELIIDVNRIIKYELKSPRNIEPPSFIHYRRTKYFNILSILDFLAINANTKRHNSHLRNKSISSNINI